MASDQRDIIQGYVNDMLAVTREMHAAFSRQQEDDRVKKYAPAIAVVARTEAVLDNHINALTAELHRMGSDESSVKKAVGTVLGAAAGIYDKMRTDDTVTRMLRDDHAALSFGTVCYELLQTTALAMKETQTADLASRHLADLTPVVMELSECLPQVVVEELASEGKVAPDHQAAEESRRRTREAWTQGARAQH